MFIILVSLDIVLDNHLPEMGQRRGHGALRRDKVLGRLGAADPVCVHVIAPWSEPMPKLNVRLAWPCYAEIKHSDWLESCD